MSIPFFRIISPDEYETIFEGFDIPEGFEELLTKEIAQLPPCKHLYRLYWVKYKLFGPPRHYVGNSREVIKLSMDDIREDIAFAQEDCEMIFKCCFLKTRRTLIVLTGMRMNYSYGETGWLFSSHKVMRIDKDRFAIWLPPQD